MSKRKSGGFGGGGQDGAEVHVISRLFFFEKKNLYLWKISAFAAKKKKELIKQKKGEGERKENQNLSDRVEGEKNQEFREGSKGETSPFERRNNLLWKIFFPFCLNFSNSLPCS